MSSGCSISGGLFPAECSLAARCLGSSGSPVVLVVVLGEVMLLMAAVGVSFGFFCFGAWTFRCVGFSNKRGLCPN